MKHIPGVMIGVALASLAITGGDIAKISMIFLLALFIAIPFYGMRDLKRNPQSHKKGLEMAKFIALWLIVPALFLNTITVGLVEPADAAKSMNFWFFIIVATAYAMVFSGPMLLYYTVAHTAKVYGGEEKNVAAIKASIAVMTLAVVWSLVAIAKATPASEILMHGVVYSPKDLYRGLVANFTLNRSFGVGYGSTTIFAWAVLAFFLNHNRKKASPA